MLAGRRRPADRAPRPAHRHVELWTIHLFRHAEQHLFAQPLLAARLQHPLEVGAVALRLGLPESHRALRVQLVGAEEAQVVEQHAVELDTHQRSTGLLHRTHEANIDRDREFLRGRNVDTRPCHGTFAARRELLRRDQQNYPAYTMKTRIPERQRHMQVQHGRTAAVDGARFPHAGRDQRERRIRRQFDLHRTGGIERRLLSGYRHSSQQCQPGCQHQSIPGKQH